MLKKISHRKWIVQGSKNFHFPHIELFFCLPFSCIVFGSNSNCLKCAYIKNKINKPQSKCEI